MITRILSGRALQLEGREAQDKTRATQRAVGWRARPSCILSPVGVTGQSNSPELDKLGIPRGRDGLGQEIKGGGVWMDEVMGGQHSGREGVVRHAGTRRGWEPQRGLKVPTGNKASRRCGKCVGRGREQA